MRYLLDSMLLIDHANGDAAAQTLLGRLFEEGHELFTCDVVTCETLSLGDDPDLDHIKAILHALEYIATSPQAANWAGDSRRARHQRGGRLAIPDALVAGAAVSIGATVVTRNTADFERQGVSVLAY